MVEQQRHEPASQWAAIVSISGKIGCSAQTLHNWVTQAERDAGKRAGPPARSVIASRRWSARTAS